MFEIPGFTLAATPGVIATLGCGCVEIVDGADLAVGSPVTCLGRRCGSRGETVIAEVPRQVHLLR